MPKKIALLIGVSEYGEDIPSLSAPKNDVAAIKQVLEDSSMGAFDRVEALIDPDPTSMRLAVQRLFARCGKDDLVLLYFSGHGITNDNNELYFGTKGTTKEFYQATSVAASFIQGISCDSRAKRQVIVLDCCYSGAFAEGWQTKGVELDLQQELGAEGRVVLTSSTAAQKSFQHESNDLSLYTQYLVEGIETGAAGKKEQGRIYAFELHDYAKAKVQEAKPQQKPGIITDREGYNILLSQAPINDPELGYRKTVEKYAAEGHISVIGTRILRLKRQELGITEEKSQEIIDEVLAPYQQRLENIAMYQEVIYEAVDHHYPLTEQYLSELQDLQDILGLEDRDLTAVKEKIIAEKDVEPLPIDDSTNLSDNSIPSKESTSEETNLNFFGRLLSPFFQMTANDFFKRGLDKQNKEDILGAVADYSKAIELNPDLAEAYCNRGFTCLNLGKYQEAIADCNKAIELNPDLVETYINRSNAYLNLGKYQEAIADCNKAIELNPDLVETYINRSNAYLNLGKYQEAITDCNKAIELNPNYTLAYNSRGNAYLNLEEYQEAISSYTKAIELNPNYALAYNSRGNAYLNLGEYQEAISSYTKAIELNPGDADAYTCRGLAYLNLEEYDQAVVDCNKAIELNPDLAEAYNNRGLVYLDLEKYDQVIAECNKAIELNPNYALAYTCRGLAYLNLEEYDQAIVDFNKAIELNPDLAEAYNNRGLVYLNLEKYDQAIADLNEGIKLNPNYALTYTCRGLAYLNLEEYDQAIADYNQAIKINSKDVDTYNQRGCVYFNLEEYDQAIADFNKAIELDPDSAIFYSNRGEAYNKIGEYGKAIADCNKAIELDPDFAEAYYNRGLTSINQGNKQLAIQDFTQGAELYQQQENIQRYQDSLDRIQELQE